MPRAPKGPLFVPQEFIFLFQRIINNPAITSMAFTELREAQHFRHRSNALGARLRAQAPGSALQALGERLQYYELIMRHGSGKREPQFGRHSGETYRSLETELSEARASALGVLPTMDLNEIWFLFWRLRSESRASRLAKAFALELGGQADATGTLSPELERELAASVERISREGIKTDNERHEDALRAAGFIKAAQAPAAEPPALGTTRPLPTGATSNLTEIAELALKGRFTGTISPALQAEMDRLSGAADGESVERGVPAPK